MSHSVLEQFVLDYAETAGGAWDEVEPQVVDLLVPPSGQDRLDAAGQVLRVAFDPEALSEHPGSQLASFGTPLVERLLDDAVHRGRFVELYFLGLNLAPHDLAGRARRSLALTGLDVQVAGIRALHFAQAVFWFQATFISDQKEQDIVPVGLDLHYGRQVRQRERLLDAARLADRPAQFLAEAPRLSLAAAYPLAREECQRTLTTLAHARDRELKERLERQVARMQRYYADMRRELAAAPSRAKDAAEAQARLAARTQALEREERVRIAELRQKCALRVHVKLVNLVLVHQPKLLLACRAGPAKQPDAPLALVWDPLLDGLEPPPCPGCRRPTFALTWQRLRGIVCPACAATEKPPR
jgi:hypothetical protein